MSDDQLKSSEELKLIVRNLFSYVWNGLRFVRLKLPITVLKEGVKTTVQYECILNESDMEMIAQLLRRGVNRFTLEKSLPVVFDRVNDMPDPEREADMLMFNIKADLLDKAKRETDTKELLQIVTAIEKLQKSHKPAGIRKIDLELCVRLAQHFDPTVTEEKVIDILKFIRERMNG